MLLPLRLYVESFMLTDPIADMFARLRNAALASHDIVVFPASKIKEQIAILLKKEGYILDVSRVQKSPQDELRERPSSPSSPQDECQLE